MPGFIEEVSIAFEVRCDACCKELAASVTSKNTLAGPMRVVSVEPCSQCLAEAKEEERNRNA